jgi:hypothetical protein
MNVWDVVGQIWGWVVLLGLIILVALVLIIIVLSIAQWSNKKWPAKSKRPYPAGQPRPTAKQDDFIAEATVVAQTMFKDNIIMGGVQVNAFRDGARWAWHWFHRP